MLARTLLQTRIASLHCIQSSLPSFCNSAFAACGIEGRSLQSQQQDTDTWYENNRSVVRVGVGARNTDAHAHTHSHTHTRTHTRTGTRTRTRTHTRTRTDIHTHTHTHTRKPTHTHTPTYTACNTQRTRCAQVMSNQKHQNLLPTEM